MISVWPKSMFLFTTLFDDFHFLFSFADHHETPEKKKPEKNDRKIPINSPSPTSYWSPHNQCRHCLHRQIPQRPIIITAAEVFNFGSKSTQCLKSNGDGFGRALLTANQANEIITVWNECYGSRGSICTTRFSFGGKLDELGWKYCVLAGKQSIYSRSSKAKRICPVSEIAPGRSVVLFPQQS